MQVDEGAESVKVLIWALDRRASTFYGLCFNLFPSALHSRPIASVASFREERLVVA